MTIKSTKSNLLIFVMANAGYAAGELTCHTREGEKYLKSVVKEKAQVKLIQARFFKTRKEKWEYLLKKHPDLELINDMMK